MQKEADRARGLLGDDSVSECPELGSAGQARHGRDVAVRQAHHPLDELGGQTASIVSWPGCRSARDRFPAADGWGVGAPLGGAIGNALSTISGRFAFPWSTRRCVEAVRETAPFAPSSARGVGSKCSTSSASVGPCPPHFRLSGCCDPPLAPRDAVGVLSSRTTAGRPSSKPTPLLSLARGVGNCAMRARNVSLRLPSGAPGPVHSLVVGVGSRPRDDENALTLVRGPDVGCTLHMPFRIEPEVGQVSEYGADSSKSVGVVGVIIQRRAVGSHPASGLGREKSTDIFDHYQSRAEDGYRAGDVGPQARPRALGDACAQTGEGHVLAGESGRQDVDRLDRRPVDGRHVAMIGDVRPVVREDARGVLVLVVGVVLAVPCHGHAEEVAHGHVETAITRAQGPHTECADVKAELSRNVGGGRLIQASAHGDKSIHWSAPCSASGAASMASGVSRSRRPAAIASAAKARPSSG